MDAPNSAIQSYMKLCPDGMTKYPRMTQAEINAVGRDVVVAWLRDNFPDKAFWISPEKVRSMLLTLRTYKPRFLTKPFALPNLDFKTQEAVFSERGYHSHSARPCLLVDEHSFYETMNLLPEAFMDLERMRVKRADQPATPLEIYRKDTDRMLETCLRRFGHLDAYTLREAVYHSTFEATEFKPSVLAALIEKFHPKRVLDFCAGRGSRLVACIAKEVDYTGVDPDSALFPIYAKMVKTLAAPARQAGYQMLNIKAQDLDLPADDMYDMVMTSPPYFDLEIYSNDPSQSVEEFPDVAVWLEKFLLTSIRKAAKHLRRGGYMIININDPGRSVPGRKAYTLAMVEKLRREPDLEYLGVIGHSGGKKPAQPMWVWRKI